MDEASGGDNFALTWDNNGQMVSTDQTSGDDTEVEWNWNGKLRSGTKGNNSIEVKYDPMGNRVFKDSNETVQRKYIVDISGFQIGFQEKP